MIRRWHIFQSIRRCIIFDFLFVSVIIFVAYTIGFVASFGPAIIAYPFLLLLLKDIYFVRPFLTFCGFMTSMGVVVSMYRHIDKKVFFTALLFSGLGAPFGMLVYPFLSQNMLVLVVGVFTLLIAVKGLFEEFGSRREGIELPNIVLYVLLFLGGFFRGALSTGGVLIVPFTMQRLRDKNRFRATQGAIWLCFNIIILTQLIFFPLNEKTALDVHFFREIVPFIPVVLIAVVIGMSIQKRISGVMFRKFIFCILLLGSLTILTTTLI